VTKGGKQEVGLKKHIVIGKDDFSTKKETVNFQGHVRFQFLPADQLIKTIFFNGLINLKHLAYSISYTSIV